MDSLCMRNMICRSIKREADAINITMPLIECNIQYL
jgi:hypothetical protein